MSGGPRLRSIQQQGQPGGHPPPQQGGGTSGSAGPQQQNGISSQRPGSTQGGPQQGGGSSSGVLQQPSMQTSGVSNVQEGSSSSGGDDQRQHQGGQGDQSHWIPKDPNGDWHSDADMDTRREMLHQIAHHVKQTNENVSQKWLDQLPQMVKQLEVSLYRIAPSFATYADTGTLKHRLQLLAMEIARKAQKAKGGEGGSGRRVPCRENEPLPDPAMCSSLLLYSCTKKRRKKQKQPSHYRYSIVDSNDANKVLCSVVLDKADLESGEWINQVMVATRNLLKQLDPRPYKISIMDPSLYLNLLFSNTFQTDVQLVNGFDGAFTPRGLDSDATFDDGHPLAPCGANRFLWGCGHGHCNRLKLGGSCFVCPGCAYMRFCNKRCWEAAFSKHEALCHEWRKLLGRENTSFPRPDTERQDAATSTKPTAYTPPASAQAGTPFFATKYEIDSADQKAKKEHSRCLQRLHEEAHDQFKCIREKLSSLSLERTEKKKCSSSKRKARDNKAPETISNIDGVGLGGKAGKVFYLIRVGEKQNLYKSKKPTSKSLQSAQDRGRIHFEIDLHGYSRDEGRSVLDEKLTEWMLYAMEGDAPWVVKVKIVCGGGAQLLAEMVESWIQAHTNVANDFC